MKTIKNLRGFVRSLRLSGYLYQIEVVGVNSLLARMRKGYSTTCVFLRYDYLETHRVSYLKVNSVHSFVRIDVEFY